MDRRGPTMTGPGLQSSEWRGPEIKGVPEPEVKAARETAGGGRAGGRRRRLAVATPLRSPTPRGTVLATTVVAGWAGRSDPPDVYLLTSVRVDRSKATLHRGRGGGRDGARIAFSTSRAPLLPRGQVSLFSSRRPSGPCRAVLEAVAAVCHRTPSTRELAPKTPHSVAHGASPIMPVPIPLLDILARFLRSVGPLKCP